MSNLTHVLLFLVLITLAGGCACDVRAWAQDKAGSSAVDCGRAPLGEQRDAYYQCTVDAFRRGDAFFVVFEQQGTDSQSLQAWASNGTEVWLAAYDGDPSGGDGASPTLHEMGCGDPTIGTIRNSQVGFSVTIGQERVECGGQTYRLQVCSLGAGPSAGSSPRGLRREDLRGG